MFFINRISYLLFNFTYVECSYLVANNLITKGTAFYSRKVEKPRNMKAASIVNEAYFVEQ